MKGMLNDSSDLNVIFLGLIMQLTIENEALRVIRKRALKKCDQIHESIRLGKQLDDVNIVLEKIWGREIKLIRQNDFTDMMRILSHLVVPKNIFQVIHWLYYYNTSDRNDITVLIDDILDLYTN